jgi:hypothetical protein
MLREDNNARFIQEPPGCFSGIFGSIYRFRCKMGREELSSKKFLTQAEMDSMMSKQQEDPVRVFRLLSGRAWWMFQDKFYWEDKALSRIEVKALLLQRIRSDERKIERAIRLMEQETLEYPGRSPIPDDVKLYVMSRDGGKCVKCEAKTNLEYDHIIPISQGGSNTVKNIQILCAACNRAKGGNIA